MSKTTSEADEDLDFVVSRKHGPCYFIDDVPAVARISRRQVDREIEDGNLTRRKRGQLSLIRIDEAHMLRAAIEHRRMERDERTRR